MQQALFRLGYNLLLCFGAGWGAKLVAEFNSGFREKLRGHQMLFPALKRKFELCPRGAHRLLWFHAASVGEYLQCEPIMGQLKKETDCRILLTYFSPSMTTKLAGMKDVDYWSYLPFDRPWDMRRFFDIARPDMVIFSKYDVWPNVVFEARRRKCPVLLIAASLSNTSRRSGAIARWANRQYYPLLDFTGAVSDEDAANLRRIGLPAERLAVTGDARFKQALEFSRGPHPTDRLRDMLCSENPVLVIGSTSGADEAHLYPALEDLKKDIPSLCIVWAPHHVDDQTVSSIEQRLSARHWNVFRLSGVQTGLENGDIELDMNTPGTAVIADCLGFLARSYDVADAVYVGGAFDTGVHNLMEPACYAKPLVYGPLLGNSYEARKMRDQGGGVVVNNSTEIHTHLREFLTDSSLAEKAGKSNYALVEENARAAEQITAEIIKRL